MEIETGKRFTSIEEGGDYCMGQGCTYKVGGRCRSEPYYGGCDYKGRGYIQVTHDSGYLKYCGPDCMTNSRIGNILDECKCKGLWNCGVTDENICPPVKALRHDYASRIFANFYIGKGLLGFVNSKNYAEVGYRINGARSYGNKFNDLANAKHNSYNNDQVRKLLAYLNQNKPTSDDSNSNSASVQDPVSTDSLFTTDVSEEIILGDKLGYYYLNPSFRVETELSFIPTLIKEASDYDTLISTLEKHKKAEKWIVGGCKEEKIIDIESDTFIFCVDDKTKKYEFALDLEGEVEELYEFEKAIEADSPSENTEPNAQKGTVEGLKEEFSGINYGVYKAEGPIVYHVAKINLENPDLQFLATPKNQLGKKTSSFLLQNNLQLAINGDEFLKLGVPKGLAISNGEAYSNSKESGEQTLFITSSKQVTIGNKIPIGTEFAVSGSHVLLVNGEVAQRIRDCVNPITHCNEAHPRTSAGISQDGKTMIIIIVDGRRAEHSIGATLPYLAKLHQNFGSYNAINFDGGGSTTLVMEGKGIVNHPTDPPDEYLNDYENKNELIQYNGYLVHPDKNIFKERTVSNHLGIYAKEKSNVGSSKPLYAPVPIANLVKSKSLPLPEYAPSYAISNDISAYPGIPINAPIKNTLSDRNPDKYNKVIDQFKVDTNTRYDSGKKDYNTDTYCNIFAWDVTMAMGAEIPHYRNGEELNANEIFNWLKNEGKNYGWQPVDEKTAQEYANMGKPAVAAKENPEPQSGHIAIIRPGKITEKGATTAQAGATNFNYGTVGDGFFSSVGIVYYIHD